MRTASRLLLSISFLLAAQLFTGCAHHVSLAPPPPGPSPTPEAAAATVLLSCPAGIDSRATQPLNAVPPGTPAKCKAIPKNGYLVADPACTPGAINPTLTLAVLQDPNFRTGCVRDNLTTEEQKNITYVWYGVPKPPDNTGESQVCELDHLVPLYLGGADSLDNIWPQCGPDAVTLNNRYFKQKDHVEVYLGNLVRAGKISLADAQHGIATDWTQYIPAATRACPQTGCAGLASEPID